MNEVIRVTRQDQLGLAIESVVSCKYMWRLCRQLIIPAQCISYPNACPDAHSVLFRSSWDWFGQQRASAAE
jgi:hypothetical protein